MPRPFVVGDPQPSGVAIHVQVLAANQPVGDALNGRTVICRDAAMLEPVLHHLPSYPGAYSLGDSTRAVVKDHKKSSKNRVHRGPVAKFVATIAANIFDSKCGKLVGVRTLADQLREYLERTGTSAAAFARLVRTSRQNIDNVLDGRVTAPRYLPDIARVMQTTVEVLTAGRYRYGQEPAPDEEAPTAAELQLLRAYRDLSEPGRAMLGAYLAKLQAVDPGADMPAFSRSDPSRKRTGTLG